MPSIFELAGPQIDRSAFAEELANPSIRNRVLSMANAEVGGQGPAAQKAFMETVFNRASARKQTVGQTLTGDYFPRETYARANRGVGADQAGNLSSLLDDVVNNGSNISNYATGNASDTVGFAGGPQTVALNGERFGVEGPDRGWAQANGFGADPAGSGSPAGMPDPERAMANPPEINGGPSELPPGAAYASGAIPPGGFAPQSSGGGPQQDQGFLSGLGRFLDDNSAELMAIGGGFLSGNPGHGFERAGVLKVAQGRGQSTSDIKEYQYAKAQGFTGTFEQWQSQKASYGGSKGGLTPIFDKEGNPWQLTQDGKLRPLTNENFKGGANKGVDIKDLGTHIQPIDKLTGQPVGEPIPKNNLEAASAKGEGAAEGKGLGENYQEIVKGANGAVSMKGTLSRLKVLSDNAYDTKAGPAIQAVRSYLGVLGVPLDKVPNGEEFTALSNKLVLDGLGGSLGTGISNADRSFIEQTVPTLSQTKEGRAQIIDYLGKVADRKIEIAHMATDYKANNKGSLKGFTDVLAQFSEANPIFPGGGPTGLPTPAAPAAAPSAPTAPPSQFTPDQVQQEIERRRRLGTRQM